MDRDLRSIVAWLVHLLNGLAVISGTVFLAYLYLLKDSTEAADAHGAIGYAFAVGAILVVLNVLRLLYLRRAGHEGEDYIMSQGGGGGGGVRVAIEAIRSELRASAEEMPEVSRCKVNILRLGPRRVRIHASYIACEGASIMELSERIRVILKERFQEMVPLGEGVKQEVEIDFESFGGKPPKKGSGEKDETVEPPPFTGAKYPVDGEI